MNKYEREWNGVWARKNLLSHFVDRGRNVYNQIFTNLFRPYFLKNKIFLEVGCGTSSLLLKNARYFRKSYGLDISDEALKLSETNAKKMRVENVRFIKGDCFKMPIKENSVDVVWSQGLIEHFENPLKIVTEHYRICQSGGVVLISTPAKYSYQHLWYKITRPKMLRKFWPWTEQEFYNKKKYEKLLEGLNYDYEIFYLPKDISRAFIILKIKK